jgi:hypothetical protein
MRHKFKIGHVVNYPPKDRVLSSVRGTQFLLVTKPEDTRGMNCRMRQSRRASIGQNKAIPTKTNLLRSSRSRACRADRRKQNAIFVGLP